MRLVISFLIVALGQPARLGWLGLVAAAIGYALFWSAYPRRFWISTLWFTAVQLVQLSWMTSDTYQGLYTWFFWAFLSFGMGLQFGFVSLLLRSKMNTLRLLAIPAAWTLMEWLRLYFLAGMTWNPVGLALTGHAIPLQMAALVGIYGLSFWVILTNVLFLKRTKWALAACAFPYLFGICHIAYHDHQPKPEPLSVLLVQPGICPGERSGVGCGVAGMIDPIVQWQSLLALVADYRNLDLVVFPEGLVPFEADQLAYDGGRAYNSIYAALGEGASCRKYGAVTNSYFCQAIADTLNTDVIAGLDYRRPEGVYNAAVFFQPGRHGAADWYGKRILLPIVEDLSNPIFQPIAKLYGITGGFAKGAVAKVFEGKVPLGPSVCYEECFSQLTRENKEAKLLVNLSNDGWYPNSKLPKQHFSHGRIRAIENGIPLIRSCSIGVTAAVDSLGRTVGSIEPGPFAGVLHTTITPYTYRTLYRLFGDGMALGASFLILGLFFRRSTRR